MIIATSSRREVLDQMEMISAFTDVLHIPNLHRGEQIMAVARQSGALDTEGVGKLTAALR